MGDHFGRSLPVEEAVCTSTSEEENIMFGSHTPYDPTPKRSEGVSPLLAQSYGFGRRYDVYSPINYGGMATFCPAPSGSPGTPTSSQGTYITQPRQGTYGVPGGHRQPRQGTYGVPGGQPACPPPSGGRVTFGVPSTSNRGTYGAAPTRGQGPQEPDPAQVAAEIVAKFQSSCGSTVEQLKSLAASTPSSSRLGLPSSPASGGTYNISGSPSCPSPTGTYNISSSPRCPSPTGTYNISGSSNYSAPSGRSGYNASISSPGSGGGFSLPPHGMICASPARTYDISSDAVSPCSCPKTPANIPKRQLPPPPSGKAATCHKPCPTAAPGSGNTNFVKPNLENILNVVQFGMGRFLELKNCHMEMIRRELETNRNHLDEGVEVMKGLDYAISSDLASLPQLIKSWGEHAEYLQKLHDKSIKQSPFPDLNAIEHPSACVNQNAYTELLKSGKNLCLEVERGLRMAELFDSKLDSIIGEAMDGMLKAYNQICSVEETRKSMSKEAQEWMRRFKETEHSVNNFLCEWQKGGNHLNQPVPDTCPPPILDLDQLHHANLQPTNCAENSLATHELNNTARTTEPEENKKGCANIEMLQKEYDSKNEGLQSLIERFNTMNTSIQVEVQQNIEQQEVLNESLRAMDDIPTPPQKSPA